MALSKPSLIKIEVMRLIDIVNAIRCVLNIERGSNEFSINSLCHLADTMNDVNHSKDIDFIIEMRHLFTEDIWKVLASVWNSYNNKLESPIRNSVLELIELFRSTAAEIQQQ